MKRPEWVTNEASWIKTCKKVIARARDLEENRIGVIVCAREMCKLAFWLREENEKDFMIFRAIDSESDTLPAGEDRKHWSSTALEREDKKILIAENQWRKSALAAAKSLIKRHEININKTTQKQC